VKFAQHRPDPKTAAKFLEQGRELLRQWHERSLDEMAADALR
jgi:hypothetical protein